MTAARVIATWIARFVASWSRRPGDEDVALLCAVAALDPASDLVLQHVDEHARALDGVREAKDHRLTLQCTWRVHNRAALTRRVDARVVEAERAEAEARASLASMLSIPEARAA